MMVDGRWLSFLRFLRVFFGFKSGNKGICAIQDGQPHGQAHLVARQLERRSGAKRRPCSPGGVSAEPLDAAVGFSLRCLDLKLTLNILGLPSPLFPGILLSRKPQETW